MWKSLENWQLSQLGRLANVDAERLESLLNTLWEQYPGLFEQLALMALDQKQISIEYCATKLQISESECVERLKQLQRGLVESRDPLIVQEAGQVARVADGSVAVWEIVREYRKIGSLEGLIESFPSLSTGDLGAALKYGQQHPEEIEALIERYETALERRRSAYPYASQAS